MTEKKDFLSELAKEVEQKKKGTREKIDSIDDYHDEGKASKASAGIDAEFDYPTSGKKHASAPAPEQKPVQESAPEPVFRQEEPAEDEDDEIEEAYGEDGTPDSFQEESLTKIDKPKRQIKKSFVILLAVLAVALGILIWYLNFAPKIAMPDFVNQTLDDVAGWAKQNKIDNTYIVSKTEYSMEIDDGKIISQSVSSGKKITNKTPLTFVVSDGPDPDEKVDFPADLKSMTKSDIEEWVSTNKLLKVKITTQYSTTIADGNVISYDLKSVSEDDFTRGTSLSVVCSKGAEPAGVVTVENFAGKTVAEVRTWATNKKVVLETVEDYSDTVDSGMVISQDKKSGDTMNQGETLTVIVSKGAGVVIPNLVGYTADELTAWQSSKNNSSVTVITHGVYNMANTGNVVAQDIAAGSKVDAGTVLTLDVSLYMPILQSSSREWLGKDYLQLVRWCDEVNGKGANIQAVEDTANASEPSATYPTKGMITTYRCEGGLGQDSTSCDRPLGLNARIVYTTVSKDLETDSGSGSGSGSGSESESDTPATTVAFNKDNQYSTLKAICGANSIKYSADSINGEILDTDKVLIYDSQNKALVPDGDGNYQLPVGGSIIVTKKQ